MDSVSQLASLCGFTLVLSLLIMVVALNMAYIARRLIDSLFWFSEGWDDLP